MNEKDDAELDGILNDLSAPPVQQVSGHKDAFVMEDIPSNEVYVVPQPEPPRPLLSSWKLFGSLSRTRTWLWTMAVLSFGFYVVCFLAAFIIGMNGNAMRPGHVFGGLLLLLFVSVPLVFMMTYANRIQEFYFTRRPETFLKMVDAQCAMWTVMGIYCWLVFLLGIAGVAMLFFVGIAMQTAV